MTHAQTLRQFSDWCDMAGLATGDRYLVVNPFFHMFGYKAGCLASLMRGATIIPKAVFDVEDVLRTVAAESVTVLPGPPTLYQSILDHPDRDRFDLSSLRIAVDRCSRHSRRADPPAARGVCGSARSSPATG